MRTLIKNGFLIDPMNRVQAQLNLVLEDGMIREVTQAETEAECVLDARGKVVAPGFIDIHMHEDPVGADGKIAWDIFPAMLRMGVTTAVGGNCGINVYDPATYLDLVDRDGAPTNVMLFAGHQFFRENAGAKDKYAHVTLEQLAKMKRSISEALRRGCVGLSYGIRYVPGINRAELLGTASCCAGERRIIAAHVRDDAAGVFGAVDEFVQTGAFLGLPMEVSHIGSMGGYGQMEQLLQQLDEYRMNGLDIAADCYPYEAFSTRIGSSTYDEGWLERYQCDYSACELTEGKYAGQRCTAETFAELRRDDPECLTVCYVMQRPDIELAYRHPNVMVGSDGLLDSGRGHPRAAGAFPRFFAEYVRSGCVSLYDGIAKVTSMAAQRLGLRTKGRLNAGADADIVIFDPERIRDGATFRDPLLPPSGIDTVLVAGEIAARNCEIVNPQLGRAVRWQGRK